MYCRIMIIIDNFYIRLFSDLHWLTTLMIFMPQYLFEFCVPVFIFYFKWMKVMLHKCDTFVLSDTCSWSCHFVMHQICFVIEKCLSADMRWFHLYTAAIEPLWDGIGEYLSGWCAIGTLPVQRGCCVLFIFFKMSLLLPPPSPPFYFYFLFFIKFFDPASCSSYLFFLWFCFILIVC